MGLRPDQVRSRVAASLLAILGADNGWRHAIYPIDLFPGSKSDERIVQDREFCVGLGRTRFEDGRQARSVGKQATTEIRVRFLRALRADALVEDYDAALLSEQAVVDALCTISDLQGGGNPGLSVNVTDVPLRQALPDGSFFLGEVLGEVRHLYTLAR